MKGCLYLYIHGDEPTDISGHWETHVEFIDVSGCGQTRNILEQRTGIVCKNSMLE